MIIDQQMIRLDGPISTSADQPSHHRFINQPRGVVHSQIGCTDSQFFLILADLNPQKISLDFLDFFRIFRIFLGFFWVYEDFINKKND